MTRSGDHASGSSPTVAELRQLWEGGERGPAIREVLRRWDEVLAHADGSGWLESALRSCGLSVEAFALQAQRLRQRNASARDCELLVESVLHTGDPWWARQLLREAGAASRTLQRLQIETALTLRDDEAPALINDWLERWSDAAGRDAAVGWWVRCGRIAEAERLLERSDDLPVWQARWALWRRQPAPARARLASLTATAETRCLTAVAAALEGAYPQAEAILRELTGDTGASEAHAWLVTVLRKQGRYDEAVRAAESASSASTVFDVVPRMENLLATAYAEHARRSRIGLAWQAVTSWLQPARAADHARAFEELAPALHVLGVRPSDPLATLAAAIERFGGNHTPYPTTTDGHTIEACLLPPNPRHLGASLQLVLWTRGPEAVRALYDELAPSVDGDPHFRIYQGEIELWLGAYEDAARIFQEVLRRAHGTRWAWIGLGASHMLQGDLQAAQRVWKEGLAVTRFAGPTLYVYRGECYRRQGDVKRARADLTTALQQKPERLSARINLALLDEHPEALAQAERDCSSHAPLLMNELRGSTTAKLEQVLEAMRGNRSSSPWHVSYHLWNRIWRRSVDTTHA